MRFVYAKPEGRNFLKENAAFLLEVQQKMRAVEGIKAEVNRQRNCSRIILLATLVIGLVIGAFVVSIAYLYPIDTEALTTDVVSSVMGFLDKYKHYLLLPIAGCATALGLVFSRQTS